MEQWKVRKKKLRTRTTSETGYSIRNKEKATTMCETFVNERRVEGSMIKLVQAGDPIGKRPLGSPRAK